MPRFPTREQSKLFQPGMVGRPTIDQFVVLSFILHIVAIAIFGDTSGTGQRRGERPWGSLNVRVQAAPGEGGIGLKLDTKGLLEPRKGSQTEPLTPQAVATPAPPPAPRVSPSPSPLPSPAATSDAPELASVNKPDAPALAAAPSAPVAPTEPVASPLANLPAPTSASAAREFLATDLVPEARTFVVPPPVEVASAPFAARLTPAPIEAIQLPTLDRELAPVKSLKAKEIPLAVPAPIEAIATVKVDRDLAPATIRPREVARAAPVALEPIAPVKVEQELVPATALKQRELPVTRPSPIETINATAVTQEFAAATALRARELPLTAPTPIETIKAVVPTQEFAPTTALKPRELALPAAAPIETLSPAKALAEFAPTTAIKPRSVERSVPAAIEKLSAPSATAEFAPTSALKARAIEPPTGASVASTGSAKAGESPPKGTPSGVPSIVDDALRRNQLRPAAPTPPAAETAGPLVNLDALRDRARQLDRGDPARAPRGLLPFPMVAKPLEKSLVEKAFDKALKRKDCREAFADMGLAAVFPLMLSTVKDDLCKW